MDLVNISYKYLNWFINGEELLELLENRDNKKFKDSENKEIEELIGKIKEIIKTIPNEVDEIEIQRRLTLDRIISNVEQTLKANKLDEKGYAFLKERYESLLKEKDVVRDGGKRYEKIVNLLINSHTYTTSWEAMSDLELLEFITQYIRAPRPPKISQETFDNLVRVGIKEDKREALWRLAANYDAFNQDISLIEDYFIEKRDVYYLTELISIMDVALDKDRIIEKIGQTHDLNFYKEIMHKGEYLKDCFNEEQKKRINEIVRKEEKNETI